MYLLCYLEVVVVVKRRSTNGDVRYTSTSGAEESAASFKGRGNMGSLASSMICRVTALQRSERAAVILSPALVKPHPSAALLSQSSEPSLSSPCLVQAAALPGFAHWRREQARQGDSFNALLSTQQFAKNTLLGKQHFVYKLGSVWSEFAIVR